MVKLNVTIPEDLNEFVSRETARRGLDSPGEYLTQLLKDAQRRAAAQRDLESKLIEGLESGEPIEADEKFWAERRAMLAEHRANKGKS